ncbi:pre-B lymphocyte protein 3 isoform X1 [Ailuropoda melanoleuca]|uniref:pre-B lymphocyte protein 3 isoform X1 n=1 Tax=Ailuropoda melanoleuca TaxID=9646 RepID=UPI001494F0EF|nr:pre-B lymphocyte protein 3 isoform X1 [Ailuropoda melanoleuca]
MACWHLALLLTGALLSGELPLGLAHLGRVSQPGLAQPEALLVFPGQVAQLSCMLSPRHATVGEYGVSWYQQRAGSAPRYLLYYRSEDDCHRPPDIPERFSAATDAAHNACILTISPVQPEDDADYYCSVGYTS